MAQLASPKIRRQFEGHDVEVHHCSFAGSWDLEDDEGSAIALDRVVIFVVAGRVTKAGFELQESSGELHRKTTVKVSDATMLRGKLRDEALAYIVQGPENAALEFGTQAYGGGDFTIPDDDEDPAGGEVPAAAVQNGNGRSDVETVGSVYPASKPRDEQLAKFLETP